MTHLAPATPTLTCSCTASYPSLQVGAAQEALHQRILAVEQSNCPAQVQALHKKVHALATSLTTLQLAPAGQ